MRCTGRHLSFVSARSVGGAVQVSPVSTTVRPQDERQCETNGYTTDNARRFSENHASITVFVCVTVMLDLLCGVGL